jgi:hypothetical protein
MSTSRIRNTKKMLARHVIFDGDDMHVQLTDGSEIIVPISRFPRLLNARPRQRERWELIGPGVGIHWEEIDEDISVANLLEQPESLLTYS